MEVTGPLGRLSNPIVNRAKTNGNLALQQLPSFNVTADQYLSIVVPGRMFVKLIKKKVCLRKLHRTLKIQERLHLFLYPEHSCQ